MSEVSEKGDPQQGSPRGSETILVVEDEAPLRGMVRTVLSRLGYRVLEAASGVEALNLWNQHQNSIQLVFTDMAMPNGMSGQQLAEELQRQRPGIPVLFTSGYSTQMLARNGLIREGAACLQKPYMPLALASRIREILDESSIQDEASR